MSTQVEPMTCRELVELVTDYLEGALSADDHRRFDGHLEGCDACTMYLDQIRVTITTTGRLTEESLDPRMRDALLETFRGWRSAPL
jgi:anti-sigma factor RsiW